MLGELQQWFMSLWGRPSTRLKPRPPSTLFPGAPANDAEAARFLTQATFGPNDAAIGALRGVNYGAWVAEQLAMPPSASHLAHVEARLTELKAANPNAQLSATQFYESFWKQAATGPDQLRQRVAFALSQIFVISLRDATIDIRGAASFYDTLAAGALGSYRALLEKVTLHPMMGVYLTYLANQKEDPATGRKPDENYAREILQLMSIGVAQLDADGTPRMGAGGPLPAYSADDVSGLAKVFTGFSWWSPAPTASTFFGRNRDPGAVVQPMIPYAAYHSTTPKSFLGVTTNADALGDLRVALDVIAGHPNTAPFIGKQLIQRLVTSNPSPAYVRRVAAVFTDSGGELGAVVRAVLLDGEARDLRLAENPRAGKLREPVIRMANWMRAFNARSASGSWLIPSTSANTSLSQSALAAPSVFNFWRPGYTPPNTRLGGQGLLGPEFQVVDEVSVAGYLNTMQVAIDRGVGNGFDVKPDYTAESALAPNPETLADRIDLLLLYGRMSMGLRGRIVAAVGSVPIPAAGASQAAIDAARLNRAKLAIFLAMAAPEYMAQR